MSKYIATRKDICAGRLLKTMKMSYKIYDENQKEISEEELAEQGAVNFSVSGGIICRGMLFNVNENGLANDLIYTTPTNYPIEGIESQIDIKSELIIRNYVELEELLKYLNYNVDLTQKDLNRINRTLITHRWWLEHNMELFGWKKCGDGSYSSGGVQTFPMNIYDNLSDISLCKNGKPSIYEPGYSLIKKIR